MEAATKTMSGIDIGRLIAAVATRSRLIAGELTALDQAIGDGDHGINMKRGFEAVRADATIAAKPLPEALKAIGTKLVMTVGGASGPLFGTLFLTLGKELPVEPDRAALAAAFAKAVDAVAARGKSQVGQKTMLDVLYPVAAALSAGRSSAEIVAVADAAVAEHEADEGDPRPRLLPRRPLDRPHRSGRALERVDDPHRRRDPGSRLMKNVGIVIVSHSPKVAEGTADMVRQMVGDEVPLAWCGGDPEGGLGTSVEAIMQAIDRAWSEAGVAILVDLGGAETNSEMAVEMIGEPRSQPHRDLQRADRRGRRDGGDRGLRRRAAEGRRGDRARTVASR